MKPRALAPALLTFVPVMLSVRPNAAALTAPPVSIEQVIPAGPGQQTLALQIEATGVRAAVCAAAPCSASGASFVAAAEGPTPHFGRAEISVVTLEGGRTMARVDAPGDDAKSRFVTLVAAPLTGKAAAPSVLWSGWTGLIKGEAGEERDAEVVVEKGPRGARVLVGERRADVTICGRPTLVGPRVVDPATLELTRGASFQNLSEDERAKATKVTAVRATDTLPEGRPLVFRASSASSAMGKRLAALTDGDLATAWSEGKQGDGRGEFITMSAPEEVALRAIDLVVRPTDPVPDGAAPKRFYLATSDALVEVTLPEDAWQKPPGTRYAIKLPAEIHTECLAVVLEDAFAGSRGDPHVTIAEVIARTSFDDATPEALAGALAGGAARSRAAAALLVRSGSRGVSAAIGAYEKLDDAGRELARSVIDSAPCREQVPFFAARFSDGTDPARVKDRPKPAPGDVDPEVAHARDRLRRCGRASAAALSEIVRKGAPPSRVLAADELAALAPADAVTAILDALAGSGDAVRRDLRAALARAAKNPRAQSALSVELAEDKLLARPEIVAIDLLRASGPVLGPLGVGPTFAKVTARATSFRARYLLQAPAADLAASGDASARAFLETSLRRDEDAHVRARAADLSGRVAVLAGALAEAVDDADPRVREAAIQAIADAPRETPPAAAAIPRLRERLAKDDWTFVRRSAAHALGALPADAETDRLLVAGLPDPSPDVRVEILDALAAHHATQHLTAIRERQDDEDEFTEVRAHAILALGALCDNRSLASWTGLAQAVRGPGDDRERRLGGASIAALGLVHPPDLAERLAPLLQKDAPPAVREMVRAAVAQPGACSGASR